VHTPQDAFDAWAPPGGRWSPWAKPSLFHGISALLAEERAKLEAPTGTPTGTAPANALGPAPETIAPLEPSWLARLPSDAALIVDMPVFESIALGLALASRGFAPVPLFNTSTNRGEIVDVRSAVVALAQGADILRSTPPRVDGPPAFLLDSRRLVGRPMPGQYDNRWAVMPQDFPSAAFLGSHGIRRVLVVRPSEKGPDPDLLHVLSRYERDRLALSQLVALNGRTTELRVATGWWQRFLFAFAVARRSLKRNAAGGFGALIPEMTSRGRGFG
jgi:hypothetical protein